MKNKRFKSKAGMTLVEMIISLVIVSIFMTSTMGIFISSNNIFLSTSKATIDRQIGSSVFSFMKNSLRYSTHLGIYDSSEAATSSYNQYFIMDETDGENHAGHIKYKSKSGQEYYIYTNDFYAGRTVQYMVKETGSGHNKVQLTVNVFREGKRVFTHSEKIKCVNLSLIATGNGANMIMDKSSEDAINPFITFSVDERLVNGGSNAFTFEFNINDYLARYNQIQSEYTSWLNILYGDYSDSYTAAGSRGVNNTSTDIHTNDRLEFSAYTTRTENLYKVIYGTPSYSGNPVQSGSFQRDPFMPAKDSITSSTDIYQCQNIRRYYQEKIYDLLGFMPTNAFAASEEGTWRIVSPTGVSGSYQIFDGNPYYGVIATKEELYFGYLLTHFDKNHDKQISKSEYPEFTDPDTFFAGTSLKTYMNNTNTAESKNKMVIMSYFKDNVADDYSRCLSETDGDVYLYTSGESTNVGYAYSTWKYSAMDIYMNGFTKPADDLEDDSITITSGAMTTIDTANYSGVLGTDILRGSGSLYHPYQIGTSSASNFNFGTYTSPSSTMTGIIGRTGLLNAPVYGIGYVFSEAPSGYTLSKDLIGNLRNSATLVSDGATYTVINGDMSGNDNRMFYIVPHIDMAEGWYYIQNNSHDYFFYLEADNDNNSQNIAVKSASGSSVNDSRIVLQLNNPSKEYDRVIEKMAYAQAKYQQDNISERGSTTTKYKAFNAHQFTDYALYGVDWNSWFLSSPNGILNRVINGVVDFADYILDTLVGTSLTTTKINITDSGQTLTPENARFSLGNRSNFNISNGITGATTKARSFNMAEVIYSTKRGTWYYLPTNSTRLSAATSQLSFTSNKDQPTIIDVEFNNNKTWRNSTAMCYDIEQRRLTSSGAFGLIDTTSDVLWIALPVGNQTDIQTESNLTDISIDGTTLAGFYASKKNYTISSYRSSITVSATAYDNQSTVKIYKGDNLLNSGTKTATASVSLTSGANLIKITSTTKDGKTTTTYAITVNR